MKLRFPIIAFYNIIIVFALLLFSLVWGQDHVVIEKSYVFVTALSAFTLLFSLWQLRKMSVNIISFSSFFLILLHVFTFGYYYLKAFGKEQFYIYADWFSSDLEIKCEIGLFAICAIEAIFTGMLISLHNEKSKKKKDYKFAQSLDEERKKGIVFTAGIILFLLTFPCRLYIDYISIVTTRINGEYAGFSGIVGVIDDLQTLFIPSLLCLMFGKRDNKKFCHIV